MQEQADNRYATPATVFDAYRTAIGANDSRTELLCQHPEIRPTPFQAYAGSELAPNPDMPRLTAVLKKFGVDSSDVSKEYYKQYQIKHGVDLEKLKKEHKAKLDKAIADYFDQHGKDAPYPHELEEKIRQEFPETDHELLETVVNTKVVDKIGFAVAVMDAVRGPNDPQIRFGSLKDLRIEGDTAVGKATKTILVRQPGAEKPGEVQGSPTDFTFHFRKTENGWLISGFGDDIPAEPPAPTPKPQNE